MGTDSRAVNTSLMFPFKAALSVSDSFLPSRLMVVPYDSAESVTGFPFCVTFS